MSLETGAESVLLPRTESCQPHGLAILSDELIFSDVTSHQIKKLSAGQTSVIIGCGKSGRKYGAAKSVHLTQPSSLAVVGKSIYICDTAESCILLCSPTQGMMKFYDTFGQVYDAFNIHVGKNTSSLTQAISIMTSVNQFYEKARCDIKTTYSLSCKPQGPQGFVSAVFQDNIKSLLEVLQSLRDDYPQHVDSISTESISTKPNELVFSITRGRVLTPDPFQFGEILPKVVTQHVLKCSASTSFLYVLNPTGTHYEDCRQRLIDIDVPFLSSRKPGPRFPPADIRALRDYKIKFFQGVRQNSIRNSNTKNKAGTLPVEAYGKIDPEPEQINFADILLGTAPLPSVSGSEESVLPQPEVIFTKGSKLLVKPTDASDSNIIIAETMSDITEKCTEFTALIYCNDILDILTLDHTGEKTISCSRIIKEVQPDSVTELSDYEYELYLEFLASPTVDILSEDEQLEESLIATSEEPDESPQVPLRTSARGRVLRKPSTLTDYVMI